MGVGVCIGAIGGTIDSRPYDERTYVLALTIILLQLFIHCDRKFDEFEQRRKNKDVK